jgi:hypothetical protein
MILDIDNPASVQAFVKKVTEEWFNPDTMYTDLKACGETNSSHFWHIADHMVDIISKYRNQTSEEFLNIWNQKCSTNSAKIMGYHCTRHSNKRVFTRNGIVPLSENTIEIYENQNVEAEEMWKYRSKKEPGPHFLLSYKFAKRQNNSFCSHGPEILLSCAGQQTNVDSTKSIPLIIHCEIPYSILHEKHYFAFCILRAYFNIIDPEPEDNLNFDGYSIDLKGTVLDPQYIVKMEEL